MVNIQRYDREFIYKLNNDSFQLEKTIKDKINNILKKIKELKPELKSENKTSWRRAKPSIKPKNISDLDKSKHEITCLLNKLAPSNFDNISQKIQTLISDKDNLLNYCVDEVFQKAVYQPVYCPYYVKLLLNFSEKNHEIDGIISEKCEAFTNIININNCELTKNETYEEFCAKNKIKQFKIGYSQFIGELYNKNLIVSEIIDILIMELLDNIDTIYKLNVSDSNIENNIVSLTKIILTTYKKYPDILDNNIDKYKEIYKLNISTKLKFKILDIIELKTN